MIYTGNYQNCKQGSLISISGDGGKEAGYKGPKFSLLAPKLSFWQKWHDNIGLVSEEMNNDYYITEYYRQVLLHLDPAYLVQQLDNSVLLCYEESQQFCHRHIVAAWLELKTGLVIPEIKIENNQIIVQDKPRTIKSKVRTLIK